VSATLIPVDYGQLPALQLRAADGAQATITLFGAHLVSWRPAASTPAAGIARERLFMSSRSALDGKRAIRGGVPVIFPQFATRGPGMRHGFARVSNWRVVESGEQDGAAFAELALAPSDLAPELAAAWPHPFELRLRVTVHGQHLAMRFDVRNTGNAPFPFSSALHTYHLVEDIEAIRIDGVEHGTLAIVDKLDQVFEHVAGPIGFDDGADRLTIARAGFTDAVVWNPGAADAAALDDMDDEEYRRFVCIEPLILGPQVLEAGGMWRGDYRVTVAAA
jgi:glucose-6-phosphate 1-epimerase